MEFSYGLDDRRQPFLIYAYMIYDTRIIHGTSLTEARGHEADCTRSKWLRPAVVQLGNLRGGSPLEAPTRF